MTDKKFNTGDPLGYFITWTSYGTWLPGDERGWQRKGDPDRSGPNMLFQEMAKAEMKETAFFMAPVDREIVKATVHRHCEFRQWELHTIDARTNHTHVVVTAPGYKPETARRQFKAWCTRKLKAIHSERRVFWAEGGSRRWLNTQEELDVAITYVNEAQD